MVVPVGMGWGCPVCICCPWSPGRGAAGCRWCWQLGAGAEESHRSPGLPRHRRPCCPTPPVRSGGCQPDCLGTSCCQTTVFLCMDCCSLDQRGKWSREVEAAFDHLLGDYYKEWMTSALLREELLVLYRSFCSLEIDSWDWQLKRIDALVLFCMDMFLQVLHI